MIDYRELIKKYINHVGECEGVSFIQNNYLGKEFSKEEKEELIKLDKEAYDEQTI